MALQVVSRNEIVLGGKEYRTLSTKASLSTGESMLSTDSSTPVPGNDLTYSQSAMLQWVATNTFDDFDNFDFQQLDSRDLCMKTVIAEGSTATVYRARFQGITVAVKEIFTVNSDKMLQVIRRELEVLSKARHPNILRCFGLLSGDTSSPTPGNGCRAPVRLCMEYCCGGSLFDLLHNQNTPMCWLQRMKILLDTASAVGFLHSHSPPIIHRDLKSLNLLLLHTVNDQTENPHIKLADFGISRGCDRQMTSGAGTLRWRAPEVFDGTEYTEKADVFSYAMVAYEVVSRCIPFDDLDDVSASFEIQDGSRPDLKDLDFMPKEVPAGLLNLISRCWDEEPTRRSSFSEINQDLFIVTSSMSDRMALAVPDHQGIPSVDCNKHFSL